MAQGDIARQMGSAPVVVEKKPKINRFAAIFGKAEFKLAKPGDPLVFTNGTKQSRLAECIIAFGNTGAHLAGCWIVRRESSDGKQVEVLCQLPSTGGKFKSPVINVANDENASNELADYCTSVVKDYKVWRKEQVALGNTTSAAPSRNGLVMSDEERAELGI